jgi:hypothetical protein
MLRLINLPFDLTLALLIVSPAVAQEDQCSQRKLTIYVQDSLGKPISGLTPADFESQFRGKPVKIVSVIPDQRTHRIVILLDASMILSSPGCSLLGSPTSSDILYAITDAGDNSSHAAPKDVAKALTSSGVHLFVSLLGSNPAFRNRTPEEIMGPEDLNDLVHKTGGKLITPEVDFPHGPKNPELFMASLKTFDLSLVDDYLVDIALPEAVRRYEDWTIKLSKENRQQWKDAKVLNAKELAPCQQ